MIKNDIEESIYGYVDKTPTKPQTISFKLIIERNLIGDDIRDMSTDAKAEKILKMTHIHLDRAWIFKIDNLSEYLCNVTHLYLHHNCIEKIENLEFLEHLKFLVLSNNKINKIENLSHLNNLKLLDLSDNKINDLMNNLNELPKSLALFDIRNNPCLIDDYKLIKYLNNIKQLNGKQIKEEYSIDDNDEDDNNDEEEEEEENKNYHKINNQEELLLINEDDLTKRIIENSKKRQLDYELNNSKDLNLLRSSLENESIKFCNKLLQINNQKQKQKQQEL
jgi:Leucine-rich repeat (LRR) protein